MSAITGGVLFQNSVYVGINLENILYGIELVLYIKTMQSLLNRTETPTNSDLFYAIFSTVMLLMSTIWVSVWGVFCGQMWLQNTDFPGGADVFWVEHITVWYAVLATAAIVVLQLMTDGLMIFRCWAVWNSYRVIILPLILWTGTLVLGILVCWVSSEHEGFFFRTIGVQVGLAYFGVSVFLTVMLTWMMCYRVLQHGRLIREHLEQDYASPYYAIVALVIESVLPYTLSGILVLVALGLGSRMICVFGSVYALLMCVSPQMLILRLATGTAWTKDMTKQSHSTIQFFPLDVATQAMSAQEEGDDAV